MAKRKASSHGESSKRSERGSMDEATSSKKGKFLKLTNRERALLKNEAAIKHYETDIGFREIEMGRMLDFDWLAKETNVHLDTWLNVVGWNKFVSVKEMVYPRLIRILYANLDPYTMKSCIGDKEINLNVEAWCGEFNVPNLTQEEEAPIRDLSKEALFKDLFGEDKLGHRSWINLAALPQEPTIRLAVSVLMNIIIPKKGSKEQIKEEEARILYALKYGGDLNIAREVVDRVKQSTIRRSTPLCYPMHIMRIIKKAGINLTCAGDVELKELKITGMIDSKTLSRLGFKLDFNSWSYVGRGKTKFTDESELPTGGKAEEGAEAQEAAPAESSRQGPTPKPKTKHPSTPTQIPQPSPQFQALFSDLSNQIAHLSSHLTERLDYLQASVSSKLDSFDSKLDDLHTRVRSCETHLSHLTQPPPHPSPSSSPPQHHSSSPKPSSPLFSMEDLLASASQPSQPTPDSEATPSPQPKPTPTPTRPPKSAVAKPS